MSSGEQTLLVALVAFAAGVALGRVWARLRAGGLAEARKRREGSIHYILGLDYLASGQIDPAVTELTRAAQDDTEAMEIYLILGNLFRQKGQVERAIQIHQSILHRPGLTARERAHALLCLGLDFKRAGFRNRAFETLEEVRRLDSGNTYALEHLRKIHEEEHDWQKALAVHQQSRATGGSVDATLAAFLHDQIGQSTLLASNEGLAARSFEAAIECDRRLSPAYLHLGDLRARQGLLSEAVELWGAMAKEVPEHAYLAFDRLEKAYTRAGETEKIDRVYQEVIEQDGKDWRAHLALARRRAGEGRTEEAFDLLLAATTHNPHAVLVHLDAWNLAANRAVSPERIRRYQEGLRGAVFFLDPHVCVKCHYRADGILWRCPHCQAWNSFVEERLEPRQTESKAPTAS